MRDEDLAALFLRQAGVITYAQAIGGGLTPEQVRQREKSGRWRRMHRGVYRLELFPHTWLTDLWVGIVATGGVAGFGSAARLHRFEPFQPTGCVAEVVVEHGRWRPVDGVRIRQSTQIGSLDQGKVNNVPSTGRARTVLDLGATMSPDRLGKIVDELLRKRLITQMQLWDVLVRHSVQGRNGCGPLRAVLEQRRGQERLALSDWSYAVANLLESAGLPRPILEFKAHDDRGRFLAQIDLAYPGSMVAIELDSVSKHNNFDSFHRDRSRARQLTVEGWAVLQFTWKDFVQRPSQLITQVQEILSRAVVAQPR